MRRLVDAMTNDLLLARQAEETTFDGDAPFHISSTAAQRSSLLRNRATTFDSSAFSNMSSSAAMNRTFVDSKLNMSETSGKALLLPRINDRSMLTASGGDDSTSLRDRRVSPLGYARLSPEAMPRFSGLIYYLNKARSFVRGGRLAPPPTIDELTEQMPLQISSSVTSAAAAGSSSSRSALRRVGRTGPAALMTEENVPASTSVPIIIRTPEPTRRMPTLLMPTNAAKLRKLPATASDPQLLASGAAELRRHTSAATSSAIAMGKVSAAGVHRRGIGRRRIFDVGENSQQTRDAQENLREFDEDEEVGDDGGKKDLLR